MEKSLTVPSGESKHEISNEATCESSNDMLCSQEDLLYGNETESLVTEKILNQLEHPDAMLGDSDKQSETENESSCGKASQVQSIYPEADINPSETETLVGEDLNKHKEEGGESQASQEILVENELSGSKTENNLEAVFSGSESDHTESPVLHQEHSILEKDKNDVNEQVSKPKRLPALSLVAEYADSGNDTEEELQQAKCPVFLPHLGTPKQLIKGCDTNLGNKQSDNANEHALSLNVNKTSLKLGSSEKEPPDTLVPPLVHNIKVPEETTCLQTLDNPSLKDCRWSEDDDKDQKSKWEVDEKMESGSSSESVGKISKECASADFDSDRVRKQKEYSKDKKHKKKKKKKSRRALSNGQDKETRREKNKSSHKDRSRYSSSSESEQRNDRDHHSVHPAAERKRQNTDDQKKSRSPSRTRSPRRKHKHSRSRSHNRSRSRSRGSSNTKKRRRHSRSRSRDKSCRRSRHSPSSKRRSLRHSRSRSHSRNRSRTHDSHTRKKSPSYRRRDHSRDRRKHSETRGGYKSSRERSPRRRSHSSPQRRDSSDSYSSSKREKQRPPQDFYKTVPPSHSIATVEDTTQKVQKTPHTEDKPDEKQFTIDKPSEKHSSDDKLSEKQSTIDKPSEKHSSDDKPSEKQPSIDKPSEKQPSIRKPKKAKVVPSPKSENSDEELWAELEQLTYSSSSTTAEKKGKLEEKSYSRRDENNAGKHVKDDILPLVSIPDSLCQEEGKRWKTENAKKAATKSGGFGLWKPLKPSSNSVAEEAKQDSEVGETVPGLEPKVEALDTQGDPAVMTTTAATNSATVPGDGNKDVVMSEEGQQNMDVQTPVVDKQQNLDTQTSLKDNQQNVATATQLSDKSQDVGAAADEQQSLDAETPHAIASQSKTLEEKAETSEDPEPIQAPTSLHPTSEEEAEKKSLLETPPKSLIKPFVSQFKPMQPTVIPGLDLMNPNFKSPPPPPPPPFSQGGMNAAFSPSSQSIPPVQGVTGVGLPPPPLPPWARFTPPPGQHQHPPPPFPANVHPPSLPSLRLSGPPLWGGSHMQQNMPNFAGQNQTTRSPLLFPPQVANFKIAPPLMGLGTAPAPQKQIESSENTNDGKPKHQTTKGLEENLTRNAETDGMDSVATPVDMEMSSPEGDIIDKLNEEFWESQQKERQEITNVDKNTADVDADAEEESLLDDRQLGMPYPHSPASPASPPSQAFPVSPPYSPGGEEVNLDIPEVLEMKQERREKKDKSKKKKRKAKLSAKSLSVIDRIHRQARVEEEAKHVLRIYYKHRDINKEEYKSILRRAVPQVTNSNHSIDPERIRHLVKKYVAKIKGQRLLKQDAR